MALYCHFRVSFRTVLPEVVHIKRPNFADGSTITIWKKNVLPGDLQDSELRSIVAYHSEGAHFTFDLEVKNAIYY